MRRPPTNSSTQFTEKPYQSWFESKCPAQITMPKVQKSSGGKGVAVTERTYITSLKTPAHAPPQTPGGTGDSRGQQGCKGGKKGGDADLKQVSVVRRAAVVAAGDDDDEPPPL